MSDTAAITPEVAAGARTAREYATQMGSQLRSTASNAYGAVKSGASAAYGGLKEMDTQFADVMKAKGGFGGGIKHLARTYPARTGLIAGGVILGSALAAKAVIGTRGADRLDARAVAQAQSRAL